MGLSEAERNDLLRAVQAGVPLEAKPFAAIGESLGLPEATILEQLRQWSESGILREISAVLEGSAFDYESALVTGRVSEAQLEDTVKVLNAHPTVTHNYLRNHDYNSWFTLSVPRHMGIDETLELLARESGIEAFHPLRRTATFKIGVNFDPQTLKNRTAEAAPASGPEPVRVGEREARLFRALQTPLPLEPLPFAELAQAAGVATEELLAFAREHLGGAIRRYVGTLRHRKLGVRANGMVVWRVPESRIAAVGAQLARAPEVSHCYARECFDGFPYSLYSMTHGPSRVSCRESAARLSSRVGIDDYSILFSEREFKKVRLRYFLPELDQWWSARTR